MNSSWLESISQSARALHVAARHAESRVPAKHSVQFASLLTALLTVVQAVDAFLDALHSDPDEDEKTPPA